MFWKDFFILWLMGACVVFLVRYCEEKFNRKLYPAAWACGVGILHGFLDLMIHQIP